MAFDQLKMNLAMATPIARIMFGVVGFLSLVGFSLLGEFLAPLLPIRIPAPLIGMLLLFAALIFIDRVPYGLAVAAKPLLGHMSLLFVPAILGVWHYQALIKSNGLSLILAVVVTTILALAATAWVAEKVLRKPD